MYNISMYQNLIGRVFGRLTVLAETPNSDPRRRKWACRCECGTITSTVGYAMLAGKTQSCGCHRRDVMRALVTTHGHAKSGKEHPLYRTWAHMRARCSSPAYHSYHRYGGRGITIDPRWDDFSAFLSDMGDKPKGYSLDRIDNNGNYSPSNCRWASPREQANNTMKVSLFEHLGKSMTLAEWSRETGINKITLWRRLNELGWPPSKAFSTPAAYRSPPKTKT